MTIWIAFGPPGMLLRLGVVLAAALWLVGYAALDPAPLLFESGGVPLCIADTGIGAF